jgi:nitrogen fixation NifU-like protein
MSDLQDLYQELIIDHGRHPRHFGPLSNATRTHEGYNPLCGDRLQLYLFEENGVIKAARFEGSGCVISTASASLMMEMIQGKSIAQVDALFTAFHQLLTQRDKPADAEQLGKLMALAGVAEYPVRIKCATLCWHTVQAALKNSPQIVSTE